MKLIELTDIDISTTGFQIMDLQEKGFDLTTAINYGPNFMPLDGGIKVLPKFNIHNNVKGRLLVRQICTAHKFNISVGSEKIIFELPETNKDTMFKDHLNYSTYKIKDGQIFDALGSIIQEPVFFDSLQRELFKHWTTLDYSIDFTTSYALEVNENLHPIFEFDWKAKALCLQEDGNWKIQNSDISTVKEINDSIRKEDEIKVMDTTNMNQLSTTMENHLSSNKELLKK